MQKLEIRNPESDVRHRGLLVLEEHDAASAEDVLSEWRGLEARVGPPPLMASAVWTETWLHHYGDLVPFRFVVARESGACSLESLGRRDTCRMPLARPTDSGRRTPDSVVGVCLLTTGVDQHDGPLPLKTRHVGTAGEPESDSVRVEHNALLVEPFWQAAFLRELVGHVERDRDWDEFRLEGFTAADLPTSLEADSRWHIEEKPNHVFDLAAARRAGSDALSRLGASTRKTIKKNLKAYGDVRTEWAESVDEALAIFEELVSLHQARWTAVGEPGCYASRRFLEFHRDAIRQLFPRGEVALFRVSRAADGETLGCLQLLIDRNRALVYQGGSAPYEGKWSPGLVADYLCIEECLRRGVDAYDFLGGDTHHKRRLGTTSGRLAWAALRRRRWKFAVTELGRGIKRAVRSRQ